MFIEREDIQAGEVVWLFTGPIMTDADYEAYLGSIARLIRLCPKDVRPVGVQVVDASSPAPNAYWRKRIAEETRVLPRADALYCMVTTSPLIRGVVTAINWIRRPPYAFAVRATLEDALSFIEATTGRAPQSLPRLYREARAYAAGARPAA